MNHGRGVIVMKTLYKPAKIMIIVLIFVLFGLNTQVRALEIPEDKFGHAAIGFIIGAVSTKWMDAQYTVEYKFSKDNGGMFLIKKSKERDFWFFAVPVISIISYGIVKELTDTRFDNADFLYSVAGGVAGITLISW